MDPRVLGALSAHGGLITYAQLLDLGVSPSEVRRLKRQRFLHQVRRGVFTTTELWESLDEFSGRPRLVARAVVLTMTRAWVLSHNSAADELGVATLRPPTPLTHITRPGWTNAWTENGVKHHLAGFNESQVVEVNGIRALNRARVAVDIAREHGIAHGTVACDSVLRLGTTKAELLAAAERMVSWPGKRSVDASVELGDGRAENPHETLGRLLVIEAGLGTPDPQFPVRTSDGIKWCDIRVGNHIIETDGRIKLRHKDNGGVADDVEEALWEEKRRERLVSGRRLFVSRVIWEDYWGRRRAEAIRRLQSDNAESIRLYGPELSEELAREAEEIRRRYGERRPA